jgi:hypothetical protein
LDTATKVSELRVSATREKALRRTKEPANKSAPNPSVASRGEQRDGDGVRGALLNEREKVDTPEERLSTRVVRMIWARPKGRQLAS